jgi:4a-hydroxytetrahydrobiopterin dehydratase
MTATVLLDAELAARLAADLPHWAVRDGHITRVFRTGGWKGSVMVVNAVAHLAEAAWHHPDISVSWDKVEVRLQTHDAGGITAMDLALARKIEAFVMWRPAAAEGGLVGTPNDDPRFTYVKA